MNYILYQTVWFKLKRVFDNVVVEIKDGLVLELDDGRRLGKTSLSLQTEFYNLWVSSQIIFESKHEIIFSLMKTKFRRLN